MARNKETRLAELMALIAKKEAYIERLNEVLGKVRQQAQNLMNSINRKGDEINRV